MTRKATGAVIAGRWAEANDLAVRAHDFGLAIAVPDADGVFSTLRGSLVAAGAAVAGFDFTYEELEAGAPGIQYVAVLWTLAKLSSGDRAGAERALAGFVVEDMPASHDLEPLMALAVVMAPAGTNDQRDRTYVRLAPFAGLHGIVGGCAS